VFRKQRVGSLFYMSRCVRAFPARSIAISSKNCLTHALVAQGIEQRFPKREWRFTDSRETLENKTFSANGSGPKHAENGRSGRSYARQVFSSVTGAMAILATVLACTMVRGHLIAPSYRVIMSPLLWRPNPLVNSVWPQQCRNRRRGSCYSRAL
jgi:hypothetical protein